jgi:hypothetical protein
MTRKILSGLSVPALLLLLAAGCQPTADTAETDEAEDAYEASSTARTEQPGTGRPGDVNPVEAQMWLDDFTIGNNVQTDGSIAMGDQGDDFAPGEKVFVSMEVGDAPAGATVRVDFLREDDEDRPVATTESVVPADAHYLSFEADTTGWMLGDYRAEVWVGDERVNEQHFQVVEHDQAES